MVVLYHPEFNFNRKVLNIRPIFLLQWKKSFYSYATILIFLM